MNVQLNNRIITLVVSLFAVATLSFSGPHDQSSKPNGVTPLQSSVKAGSSETVEVTMDSTTSTDQVVSLSSSSGYVAVPISVTVPAGSSAAYFTAYSSSGAPNTSAVITASCNGGSATGAVVIAN